jgi:hypothetical protein
MVLPIIKPQNHRQNLRLCTSSDPFFTQKTITSSAGGCTFVRSSGKFDYSIIDTDPDGRAAGDDFETMDEVAMDFARTYNDDTARHRIEYGSSIYKKDNNKYTCTVPSTGTYDSVTPSVDPTHETKATVHSHPAGPNMYTFSSIDEELTYKQNIPVYLVNADGILLRYDPTIPIENWYDAYSPFEGNIPIRANQGQDDIKINSWQNFKDHRTYDRNKFWGNLKK